MDHGIPMSDASKPLVFRLIKVKTCILFEMWLAHSQTRWQNRLRWMFCNTAQKTVKGIIDSFSIFLGIL